MASIVVAGVLVLGACASEDSPTAGTSTRAVAEPVVTGAPASTEPAETPTSDAPVVTEPVGPTPYTEALDRYDFEGEPNKDAAMSLFSMAFGQLDGFPAPPADPGVPSGSLTPAVRALFGVWDQLTPPQRAAALAATRGEAPGGQGLLRGSPVPDPPIVKAIKDAVVDMRAIIASHIGDFDGEIEVLVVGKDNKDNDYAVTVPDVLDNGKFNGDCTITFFPKTTSGDAYVVLNTVAHEVFHCFQSAALGDVNTDARAPGWVIEGGAEWVGTTVAAPDASTPGRWAGYFGNASTSIAVKKYTALGFWAHLDESGTSPWSVFRAVWAAGATPGAWVAAGAETPAFLDSWASGMTRYDTFPPGWDTTGPGITDDRMDVGSVAVPKPGQQSVQVAPYTTAAYSIESDADVLVFTGTGHGRVSDGIVDASATDGSRFCNRPGGCECPDAAPDDVPPAPIGKPTVALSGGASGTSVTIVGLTLDEDCKEREQRAVQVVLDRPAMPSAGLLAGRVIELTSCTGPYGDWSGVMRLGGLSLNGFEVPFQDLPLEFTVGGTGVQTVPASTGGTITTPVFDLTVHYDLQITVDGETMAIDGSATGDNGMFSVGGSFPQALTGLPIQDAPPGVCPDE